MNEPVHMAEQSDEPLRIGVEQLRPDVVVLSVKGDLDLRTAPLLHERLWPLLGEAGRCVLVDLSEVDFLGSAGLAELAAAHGTGSRMVLVAGSRSVIRPLEVTGLHTLFPIFDSVESAMLEL